MKKLITDEYRDLNVELHRRRWRFGSKGNRYRNYVVDLCRTLNSRDVLDYGCGKGALGVALPFPIHEYDPAIKGKRKLPESADIVVCTDVLEHVEPECIAAVIKHVWSLTGRVVFFAIGLGASTKNLPDGRNAHLIQRTPAEWKGVIARHCLFETMSIKEVGVVRKKAMEVLVWKTQSEFS